jgi:alpha-1,3-glucan synthase
MINQFKSAIDDALASSTAVRADMRARSAKQRFPVARWVEDLETLHGASIRIHQDQRGAGNSPVRRVSGTNFGLLGSFGDSDQSGNTHRLSSYEVSTTPPEPEPSSEGAVGSGGLGRSLSLGKRAGPGHRAAVDNSNRLSRVGEGFEEDAEVEISNEEAEAAYRIENVDAALRSLEGNQPGAAHMSQIPGLAVTEESGSRGRPRLAKPHFSLSAPDSSEAQPISPSAGMGETSRSRSPSPMAPALASLLPVDRRHASHRLSSASLLSLNEVTHGQRDFSLQKVELDFTDSRGEYYQKFQSMLQEKLTAKSSENTLVIEDFLKKSEKEWSARYRAEKLARPRSTSPGYRYSSPRASFDSRRDSAALSSHDDSASAYDAASIMDEFLLGENYVRPSILKRWLQIRILDWPIYCILLALGQIMAANSYQIVLLTGGSAGDTATKLYVVGGIYIIASCLWWVVFRTCTPRYVTSAPFGLYGLAFIIVGLAPFIPAGGGRLWARNVATGMYATASASGSLYFALNFGDEGE